MLKIIRNFLLEIVDNIDSGNSNITEGDALEIAKMLNTYTNKGHKLSKEQSCRYLNMSRSSFDNYIREGLIPPGIKESGFKEKFWIEKDLIEFMNKMRNK